MRRLQWSPALARLGVIVVLGASATLFTFDAVRQDVQAAGRDLRLAGLVLQLPGAGPAGDPGQVCQGQPRAGSNPSVSRNFYLDNALAMQKMMRQMQSDISGDVDRDFALMMMAHHQGAIEMSLAELRYGSDEQLRRLAQDIVIEQGKDIQIMKLVLGSRPRPEPPARSAVLVGRRIAGPVSQAEREGEFPARATAPSCGALLALRCNGQACTPLVQSSDRPPAGIQEVSWFTLLSIRQGALPPP